jgi:predicted membrane protein
MEEIKKEIMLAINNWLINENSYIKDMSSYNQYENFFNTVNILLKFNSLLMSLIIILIILITILLVFILYLLYKKKNGK